MVENGSSARLNLVDGGSTESNAMDGQLVGELGLGHFTRQPKATHCRPDDIPVRVSSDLIGHNWHNMEAWIGGVEARRYGAH